MIEFIAGLYAGGFLVTAVWVDGGWGNKIATAAIWPFWLVWAWIVSSFGP